MTRRSETKYFKQDENALLPLTANTKRKVRFEEVDSLGIVWHGRYPSFFEDSRDEFGNKYGLKYFDNTFVIWTGIKGNAESVENNSKHIILPAYYRKELCEYLNINNIGIEINAACASSTVGIIYGHSL